MVIAHLKSTDGTAAFSWPPFGGLITLDSSGWTNGKRKRLRILVQAGYTYTFLDYTILLFLNCLCFMPVWVFYIMHFNVTHLTAIHAMVCSWLVVYDWVHSCMLTGLYQIGLFVYCATYVCLAERANDTGFSWFLLSLLSILLGTP